MHAHFFRLSMPDDPTLTSGMDAAYTYDHPLTTLPSDDRSDLGIFYPIMGHMCLKNRTLPREAPERA